MAPGNNFSLRNENRADRNFPFFPGSFGLFKGHGHEKLVQLF
jgi:hypothetical protein